MFSFSFQVSIHHKTNLAIIKGKIISHVHGGILNRKSHWTQNRLIEFKIEFLAQGISHGKHPKMNFEIPPLKNSPPFCWCLMVITFRIRCGIVQTNNNWIRFHSTKIDFDVARWKIIGRCSLPDGGWNRVNTIYLMASIGGSSLNWVAAGYEPPEDNDISFIQYNWNTLYLPIGEIVIMKINNCNVNYALFLFTLS